MATKYELSPAGVLVYEDLKKWALNLLHFTAPMFLLAFLTSLQSGLSWSKSLTVASTTVLGAVIDLLKKKSADTKYEIKK